MTVSILVVGSVNLDIVASGARLPSPGETVTGATLARHPGGKGANQALAAQRLGAQVTLLARVGRDNAADEALALLRTGGVDLSGIQIDDHLATGVALIAVAANGENQIIVAPGANAGFLPEHLVALRADAILCQLELPLPTIEAVAQRAEGFFAINLAPAKSIGSDVLRRADLIIVNDTEAAFYGSVLDDAPGLVARTHGARGATLSRRGTQVAAATPPVVHVIDSTGAGDCFAAALTLELVKRCPPQQALAFACAAGAIATTRRGAQPSLPTRAEVPE